MEWFNCTNGMYGGLFTLAPCASCSVITILFDAIRMGDERGGIKWQGMGVSMAISSTSLMQTPKTGCKCGFP